MQESFVEVATVVDIIRGKPTYEQEQEERMRERHPLRRQGRRWDRAGGTWEPETDSDDEGAAGFAFEDEQAYDNDDDGQEAETEGTDDDETEGEDDSPAGIRRTA
jgi:hypothetical protein